MQTHCHHVEHSVGPLSNVISSMAFGGKPLLGAGPVWLCTPLSGMAAKRTDNTFRPSVLMGVDSSSTSTRCMGSNSIDVNFGPTCPPPSEAVLPTVDSQVVVRFVVGPANLVTCAQEGLPHRPNTPMLGGG